MSLKHLPYEVLAMRTKCWLFEKSGNEAMILDIVYVLLFQSTFSISVSNTDFTLLLRRHIIVSHFDSSRLVCSNFFQNYTTKLLFSIFQYWTELNRHKRSVELVSFVPSSFYALIDSIWNCVSRFFLPLSLAVSLCRLVQLINLCN